MLIEELKIKRNFRDAYEYCKNTDKELCYYKNSIVKNNFEKIYIEEYYPLYLYFSYRYKKLDYSFSLLINYSEQDGLIFDENDNILENIQITCANTNYNSALQHEMLLKQGFSPGVGKFEKINGEIISSRCWRTDRTAILGTSKQIFHAIQKKEAKKYHHLDVLLITYSFRFKSVISGWNELLLKEIKKLLSTMNFNSNFCNIYIVEDDGFVDKLL
jgi:hypothetical protein